MVKKQQLILIFLFGGQDVMSIVTVPEKIQRKNWICERKLYVMLKHIDLQSQAICVDKNNLKRNLHILEDNASGVQVVMSNKWLANNNN